MNFFTVLASRPEYYDRNPTTIALSYNAAGVAPHANTTRVTYTVPSLRKAFVEMVYVTGIRDSAAGAASYMQVRSTITPSGGANQVILDGIAINNTVGNGSQCGPGAIGALLAGDLVSTTTLDASTGGSYIYSEGLKAIEYDA